MIIYCPNCKKITKDSVEYCPHCGLRIYTQDEIRNMGVPEGQYPMYFKGDAMAEEYVQQQQYYAPQYETYAEPEPEPVEPVQQLRQARSESHTIYLAIIFVLLTVIGAGAGYFIYDVTHQSKHSYADEEETIDQDRQSSSSPVSMDDFNDLPMQQNDDFTDEPITGAPVVEEPIDSDTDGSEYGMSDETEPAAPSAEEKPNIITPQPVAPTTPTETPAEVPATQPEM